MITASNKLWATAGAFALAATAVLVPVSAQADDTDAGAPSEASSTSSDVGSAAGRSAARNNRGAAKRAGAGTGVSTPPESVVSGVDEVAAPGVVSGARASVPGARALGSNPLFQNPLWWFGTPTLAPPPALVETEFTPLATLPGWMLPQYGWFRNLDFEACVLGVGTVIGSTTTVVGPYGTSTNSVSSGGC